MSRSSPDPLSQHLPSVTVGGQPWCPDATLEVREVAIAASRAGTQPTALGMSLQSANDLLNPGYLPMENGWARLDNGQLYVAAHTPPCPALPAT